eukprot:TRINITY_DN2339_c0_g1_i3.p1 TRINITY_DN2339_c0_g1~~TRINITY_DN2339_c0_g1_i3.p1  ORF type:complete len:540 (+),score=116.64 TRINITY_DN2339_c0_g1_i3:60-1622(+)
METAHPHSKKKLRRGRYVSKFHCHQLPWQAAPRDDLEDAFDCDGSGGRKSVGAGPLAAPSVLGSPHYSTTYDTVFCEKGLACLGLRSKRCKKRHPCGNLVGKETRRVPCGCSGYHTCKFGANCKELDDISHMTSFIHVCPFGVHCKWTEDILHGYFFQHPCPRGAFCPIHREVVECQNRDKSTIHCDPGHLEHERRFIHPLSPCRDGENCPFLKYYVDTDKKMAQFLQVTPNEDEEHGKAMIHLTMYAHPCPYSARCRFIGHAAHEESVEMDIERAWHNGVMWHAPIGTKMCFHYDNCSQIDDIRHTSGFHHLCRHQKGKCPHWGEPWHMEKFIHLGDATVPRERFFLSPPFCADDELRALPSPDGAYQDIYQHRTPSDFIQRISELCNKTLWNFFAESCVSAILDSEAKSANIQQAYIFLPAGERERVLKHGFEPTFDQTMRFHITYQHARSAAPAGRIVGFRVLICKGDYMDRGAWKPGEKPPKRNGRECESVLIENGNAIRVFDSQKIYPQYVIDFR